MAATTFSGFAGRTTDTAKPQRKSFFARLLNAMIEARTRQAEAYVRPHLRNLDNNTLAKLGWSRSEIDGLRSSDLRL